jgi:hypothetical protein
LPNWVHVFAIEKKKKMYLTLHHAVTRVGEQGAMDLITLAVMPNRNNSTENKKSSTQAAMTTKSDISPLSVQMTRVLASFGATATDDAVRVLLRELHRVCVNLLIAGCCATGRRRLAVAQLVQAAVPDSALATRVNEIYRALKEIQAARSTQSDRKEDLKDNSDDNDDDDGGDDDDSGLAAEEQAKLLAAAATSQELPVATTSIESSRRTRRLERRERLSRNLSPDDYVLFTECTSASFASPRPRFSQWLRSDAPDVVEHSDSIASTSLDMNSVVGTGDAARRALLKSTDEEYNAALVVAQRATCVSYETLNEAVTIGKELIDCIGALAVDWVEDVVDDVVLQRGGSGINTQTGKFTREVSVPEAMLAAMRVWQVWHLNVIEATNDSTATATTGDTKHKKRRI